MIGLAVGPAENEVLILVARSDQEAFLGLARSPRLEGGDGSLSMRITRACWLLCEER
jgi:hypothetical protein